MTGQNELAGGGTGGSLAAPQLRVVVTGASSGLGRALVVHYAQQGHLVGAIARRGELLAELGAEYEGLVIPIEADVCDGEALEGALHRFALEQGRLDLVFANAGIGQESAKEGWDVARARRIAEVNVLGATNTIGPAVTIMVEQGGGRVVGISSLAGHAPLPSSAAYGASKAWMVFYLESLALDLGETGVGFTVVMPGYIATPMVDAGRDVRVVTAGAARAAAVIAAGVARGERMIRFPRRVAWLTMLGGWMPSWLRVRVQRKRLAKRKDLRSGGGGAS